MNRYRGLYFLCGIIIYIILNLVMFSHVKVYADVVSDYSIDEDLQEAIEIIDHEDEEVEDDEGVLIDKMDRIYSEHEDENTESNPDDLQDSKDDLQDNEDDIFSDEVKPSSKSSTRSMVNTYTDSNNWKFVKDYYVTKSALYYDLTNGNTIRRTLCIFQKDKLPPYNNIRIFVDDNDYLINDYPDMNIYVVYLNEDVNLKSMHDAVSDYLDNYGYPDSNCYWEEPEPTGTPEPTVTPEPTGTPEPNEWPDYSNFFYIVIFGFGLLAGIIAGDILTRFIKK